MTDGCVPPSTIDRMDPSRIAQLLDPFLWDNTISGSASRAAPPPRKSPEQGGAPLLSSIRLNQISMYIDLLLRWNARVNLTAVRTPDEIVTRHFGESLFAARHLLCGADTPVREPKCSADTLVREKPSTLTLSVAQASHEPASSASPPPSPADAIPAARPEFLVDLGSGAGFPGLPMKIWSPQTRVTLIESNHKKVAFLREVIRALTLTNIDVFLGRAEAFPPASASLLTLRAVECFDSVLPTATSLITAGGRLALLIGQAQIRHAHSLARSLQWSSPLPIPQSEQRVLLVGLT